MTVRTVGRWLEAARLERWPRARLEVPEQAREVPVRAVGMWRCCVGV
ncbi:hypothetical protein [Streptomyces bobili]|uniref:Transposase n=1 Tax=Streptomyces bobili TaxID=67280 RepID=A0ABZ1QPH5_9ACTN|nr:hypothetical protein [Streptomyces bobili]